VTGTRPAKKSNEDGGYDSGVWAAKAGWGVWIRFGQLRFSCGFPKITSKFAVIGHVFVLVVAAFADAN
jgi:hypothetical protein